MNPESTGTDRPADKLSRNARLTRLAERIQPIVNNLLEGDGPKRTIRNVLHGTFLGHPLHPILTDIPVGAWSVTAIFDALELAGAHTFRDAADATVVIGAVGASAAALAGWADWSDTKDEPQRLGMLHAVLNGGALSLYLISLATRRAGARGFGILSAFMGYGLMSASAYLGGELSLSMQLGVKHTAVPIDPPVDFVRVLDASALADEATVAAELTGIPVLLTRAGDSVHAVTAVCTHRGAPLADAERKDGCVTCPWHGSRFALHDGHVIEGPATFDLAQFDAGIAGGAISLRARRHGELGAS